MEASFIPFRIFRVNFCEKFEFQCILLACTFSLKIEMGGGEFNFLIDYIHEMYFHKNAIFALSPLGDRMPE